jgi:serine protease Do
MHSPKLRLPGLLLALCLAAHTAVARGASDGFADLAERLLPGVVNIATTQTVKTRDRPGIPGMPPEFDEFMRRFQERQQGQGGEARPAPAPRKMQSLGSGFIIDASGIVVTNNHVIDGADEITVITHDGVSLKAELIGRDDKSDVAVLRVKPEKPLVAVAFGDSDKARVGDLVIAIGNPFGLGGSVTAGIVSARGRNIDSGPYDNFIQTDAAINHGNSGGPLFNMDGQVIGINTAIYSPSGGSVGIGFSVPSNMARAVVEQLRDFGRARRGWLGVMIQQMTPEIAESLGMKETTGVMVAGVTDGGPAAAAKLRGGDVILKFNGQEIKDRALPRVVAEAAIGKQVPVVIWRDGKEVTVSVAVGEMPDDVKLAVAQAGKPAPVAELSTLGMKLSVITPEGAKQFSLKDGQKGVLITDLAQGAPGAEKGLKPGDVIVEVQQEVVSTPADVVDRVEKLRKAGRKSALMLVQTQDGVHWVPVPLADKPGRAPG